MSDAALEAELIAAACAILMADDPVEDVEDSWYWLPPSLPPVVVPVGTVPTEPQEPSIVVLRPVRAPYRPSERAWQLWTYGFTEAA